MMCSASHFGIYLIYWSCEVFCITSVFFPTLSRLLTFFKIYIYLRTPKIDSVSLFVLPVPFIRVKTLQCYFCAFSNIISPFCHHITYSCDCLPVCLFAFLRSQLSQIVYPFLQEGCMFPGDFSDSKFYQPKLSSLSCFVQFWSTDVNVNEFLHCCKCTVLEES